MTSVSPTPSCMKGFGLLTKDELLNRVNAFRGHPVLHSLAESVGNQVAALPSTNFRDTEVERVISSMQLITDLVCAELGLPRLILILGDKDEGADKLILLGRFAVLGEQLFKDGLPNDELVHDLLAITNTAVSLFIVRLGPEWSDGEYSHVFQTIGQNCYHASSKWAAQCRRDHPFAKAMEENADKVSPLTLAMNDNIDAIRKLSMTGPKPSLNKVKVGEP